MTELLKEAFERASELPAEDQDSFRLVLADLADEALKEFRAGETEPLDPDHL